MADRDRTANVQLKFRVKERLRADLERAAQERRVSLNAEIVRRLEHSLEQEEQSVDLESLRAKLSVVSTNMIKIIYRIYKYKERTLQGDELRELGSELILIGSHIAEALEFTYSSGERPETVRQIGDIPINAEEGNQ